MPAPDITRIAVIKYNQSELDQITNRMSHTDKTLFSQFINLANKDIIFLNELIEEYNTNKTPENLRKILMQRQKMNNTYPLDMISKCELYQEKIHRILFKEIQHASQEFGYKSITQLTTESSIQFNSTSLDSSLSENIANMPHEKVQKLMTILWENKLDQIKELYDKSEPEYGAWQDFLKTHSLTVLSGTGNSRNLKVEPFDGNAAPFVLKLDRRLDQSKTAEDQLRNKKSSLLPNNYGLERQATFMNNRESPPEVLTATLVITDFYAKGDLQSRISQIHASDPESIVGSSLDYIQKMSKAMEDMQAKAIAFPDAKMNNWLIDNNNELKISDTKSLLIINVNGEVKDLSEENQFASIVYSEHLNPKEFDSGEYFSAEAMHVYMIGKNLYQALTNGTNDSLKEKDEFNDNDFSHAVFQTPEGIELKTLIQKMVKSDPENRISLSAASATIEKIKKQLVDNSQMTNTNTKNEADKISTKKYVHFKEEFNKVISIPEPTNSPSNSSANPESDCKTTFRK